MSGENNYTSASYGVKGVADSANRPGNGTVTARWKDASGNFWILFGGLGDLWKYTPATKWWTWIDGDSVSKQKAVYGTRGIASPSNKPGTFSSAVSWTDASGNFWMYSNVLWKYNSVNNQWTWINGDTAVTRAVYGIKGVADAANKPGPINPVEWTDASGNFWLYGDVLWKYNLATDMWTWVHGDTVSTTTVYGLRGVPKSTNTPGTRTGVTAWSDASGKFWLFGGFGKVSTPYIYRINYYTGNLNDLWNYDPATNLWTWVHGDTILYSVGGGTIGTAMPGNKPGARANAVSWTDPSGNFWLFGGSRYTPFALPNYQSIDDLWKYDPSFNQWTCFNYPSTSNNQDSFSVKGVESPYTKTASRYNAVGWSDASGSLWLYGGRTEDYKEGIQSYYLNDLLRYNTKTNLWSLERENKDGREYGRYGTKGVADVSNIPGGRLDAISSTDSAGNLWLFGGEGFSNSGEYPKYLNDLWKRDTAGVWTWISGLTTTVPSGRSKAVSWTDTNDQLWVFGGSTQNTFYNNDLWKFDKTTGQWTQVSGNGNSVYGIKGQPNAVSKPGGRFNAVSWRNNTGKLWLFGGDGNFNNTLPTEFNDLWSYDPAINQWTWLSGDSVRGQPGIYGRPGIPDIANKPKARQGAVSWIDTSNNVWIFGGKNSNSHSGFNNDNFFYNDLWKYNTITNVWTWMSGDSAVNQNEVYGIKGIAAAGNKPGGRYDAVSWLDATGKLWLFGGISFRNYGTSTSLLNDLWSYDTATNLWTWISGDSSINKNGTSGSKGVVSPSNKPGARAAGVTWEDKTGNLWLMGGMGYGMKGSGFLNDLWKFTPVVPALPMKFIYFTAAAQDKAVMLNWQTANELQGAHYTIQRSRDSISYDSIGTVTATISGSTVSSYVFIDQHPINNVSYYRIRHTDKDGKNTYSIVRKLMTDSAGFSYALAQNPITSELKIYLQSVQPVQLQLKVIDAAGRLIMRQNQSIGSGTTTNVIAVGQLPAGTYFITVNSGKTSITKKFIKK